MEDTLFTDIANAIRERFSISGTITPLQFGNKIDSENTPVLSITQYDSFDHVMVMILENVKDAIKNRAHLSGILYPIDYPNLIRNIPNGTWTENLTASTTLKFDEYTVSNGAYTFKYSNNIFNVVDIPSGAEITLVYGTGVNIDRDSSNYFTATSQTTVSQDVIDMFGGVDNYLNEEGYFTLNVKYSYWA